MKKESTTSWMEGLANYLGTSPTPFHAVQNLVKKLKTVGFTELKESQKWELSSPQQTSRYYVSRNDSSLIAFQIGKENPVEKGVHLVGAHTDSPCLKPKPNSDMEAQGYLQSGVEIYGSPLLSTWFDRDLSLAGKVFYLNKKQELQSCLLDFHRPIAFIPNLAIHLNRDVNENRSIQKQKEMPPILMKINSNDPSRPKTLKQILEQELFTQELSIDCAEVIDYDLCFYDTQKPSFLGIETEFFSSARLDNLLNCYVATQALIDASANQTTLLIATDHEEVGSSSYPGADGNFLQSVLERIFNTTEELHRCMANSLFVSCDMAHGVHPNYSEKHDPNHGPLLNEGPVIKINAANHRYATSGETAAYFAYLAKEASIPIQKFSVRSDMLCGSTIGPIIASNLGIKTVDVGTPMWAMHSTRETCGVKDAEYLYKVLCQFFQNE